MSLLQEPEDTSSSSGRWLLLVTLVAMVAGGTYLFISRQADDDDVRGETHPSVASAPVVEAPAREVEPELEVQPEPGAESERPDEVPPPIATPAPEPSTPSARLPSLVVLRVTSDVDGADVFIDRTFAGKTPFESSDVSPGPHRLQVSAPGYQGFSDNVEIGETVTEVGVTFKRLRLDQRVAVVHKHRLGDCTGTLLATPDGVRYETDSDDTFAVRLDALEEFSVDYLEHNLRLKVSGGRTYNFTDTEPNADKLFVFHRAVERAREQLATEEP